MSDDRAHRLSQLPVWTLLLALGILPACQQEGQRANRAHSDSTPKDGGSNGDGSATKKDGSTSTGSEKSSGEEDDDDDDDDDDDQSDGGSGATKAKKKLTVHFTGSKGDEVPGYLWLPKRREGQKFPAVLLMYGLGGSKDDGNIGHAADVLSDEGYVAMTIDWPGTGDRGKIDNAQRITDVNLMRQTADDYEKAFVYLHDRKEVNDKKMGYVGASMGAMTGLNFAAAHSHVKAMVAIVPIPNPLWGDGDPEVVIKAVAPRPLLCISTQENSDFSGVVCGNAGEGSKKLALPGGHELEGYRDEVVEATKSFLDDHLK